MNKIFNKVRKNRALAILLAFAMMLSILPLNTVNAETGDTSVITAEYSKKNGTIEDITSQYSDAKWQTVVKYDSNSGSIAGFNLMLAGYDSSVYNKITFDFTPARADMNLRIRLLDSSKAEISDLKYEFEQSDGHNPIPTKEVKRQQITYDLTGKSAINTVAGFQFYLDGGGKDVTNQIFKLHSITFSGAEGVTPVVLGNNQVVEDDNTNPNPDAGGTTPNPDEGGTTPKPDGGNGGAPVAQPTLTPDYYDPCYTVTTPEGAVIAVSYTTAVQWSQVFVTVSGHDFSAHDMALMEIEPSRPGMNLCIKDQSGVLYDWETLDETKVIPVPLKQNVTSFIFCFDSQAGGYEAGEEITAVVKSIKFVNSKEAEKPEVTEVAATLKWEDGTAADEQGRLYVNADGTKFRGMIEFPADFTGVEVGKVLTINYESTIPFTASTKKAEFAYNNSGEVNGTGTALKVEIPSDKTKLEIPITQEYADFFNNASAASDIDTVRIRLKADKVAADNYFKLLSVTYGAPSSGDEGGEVKPPVETVVPSWGVKNGPTITLNTTNKAFTCVVNQDKSVNIKYTAPVGWTSLVATVENCDYTKYTQLVVDITPATDMIFYVRDDADKDIGKKYSAESSERQKFTFDLTSDTTKLDMWIDPHPDAGAILTGEQNFIIHSIKMIDPNALPESKANFVDFKATEEPSGGSQSPVTFTVNEAGGVAEATFSKANTIRLYANFTDYEYNAGDMLVVYSDDFADYSGKVYIGYPTDKEIEYLTPIAGDGYVAYKIPAHNGEITTPASQIRWKGTFGRDGVSIKGMYIWDEATFNEVFATKYETNQVPKGLVVTYYNDIYSRGVAWNTDTTVTENALYVVKATEGMTADTVDWTSEDVVKVVPTRKDTTSKDNTYADDYVYRTWKAHVEDLEPGATYFYRAGNEETGWSKVGSFTVEKAASEVNSLQFIHVTDSQEESLDGFKKWARVLKDAYTTAPDAAFVLHTGDIVNRSEGGRVYMNEWVYAFDTPMDEIMNGVFTPAAGNHENTDFAFTDRFDIEWANYRTHDNDDIRYGGSYVVTYGDDDLVVITLNNTNEAWDYYEKFEKYQLPWMEKQLEAHKNYRFKVVQMHEGMMTAGDHTNDGECQTMRDELASVMAKHKVDLVLTGHDHVYTRTRSYYYGENPFETVDEKNPVYFDGHTPVWLKADKKEMTINGKTRDVYIEPQGTHYVCINTCGTKTYPEEPAEKLDDVIFEGDNPITPVDENGKGGSIAQPGLPMYGIITIQDDILIYDSYTYDHGTRESKLYDTFAVDKSNMAGYDDPHAGKSEVKLYGLTVPSKKYDGVPVELDLSGFNCSEPSVMDYTQFKYTITVKSGGVDPKTGDRYKFNPGNLIYGHLPKEPGKYTLKIELPQKNRYFWGEIEIDFEITK